MTAISDFFLSGNPLFMSALTLLLALVFLAAWKAPAWVRSIGLIALACGFLFGLLGIYQMNDYVQQVGDVSPTIIASGYKCVTVPIAYGLIIFVVSLIIHLCQKPRI